MDDGLTTRGGPKFCANATRASTAIIVMTQTDLTNRGTNSSLEA
jgi:hypothetical protein